MTKVFLVWVECKSVDAPIRGPFLAAISWEEGDAVRYLHSQAEKQRMGKPWHEQVLTPSTGFMPKARNSKAKIIYGMRVWRSDHATEPLLWEFWVEEWLVQGSPLLALAHLAPEDPCSSE